MVSRTALILGVVGLLVASGVALLARRPAESAAPPQSTRETTTFGVQWREVAGNPVIRPGTCLSWKCGGVGDPALLMDEGKLVVWFTAMGIQPDKGTYVANGPVIGRAIGAASPVGSLRVQPDAPVIEVGPDGTWDRYVETPTVRRVGNALTMWYLGYAKPGFVEPAIGQMSASGDSDTAWTRPAAPIYRPAPGAWDSSLVTGPTVVQGADGIWRLYYSGFGKSNGRMRNGIGLLTSRDADHWLPDGDNPIFESQPGAWDDEILEQSVVYAKGQYYLWYSGWRGELKADTPISIGLATSSDGKHWTRHASNPVLSPGAPGAWNDLSVLAPDVVIAPDGSLLMAAYGKSKNDIGKAAGFIGFWTSR